MLPSLILAYGCSEIEGSKGDKGSRSGVKVGRADAPGRVREGLLVSNILSILSKSRLYTLRPQGGRRIIVFSPAQLGKV